MAVSNGGAIRANKYPKLFEENKKKQHTYTLYNNRFISKICCTGTGTYSSVELLANEQQQTDVSNQRNTKRLMAGGGLKKKLTIIYCQLEANKKVIYAEHCRPTATESKCVSKGQMQGQM